MSLMNVFKGKLVKCLIEIKLQSELSKDCFLKKVTAPSAAASTGWMSSGVKADHNAPLLQVTELLFQVSAKSLKTQKSMCFNTSFPYI